MALGMLCDALAHYLKAKKEVEKSGVRDRANITLQRAYQRFYKLMREFGMTPASRASIEVEDSEGRERGGNDKSRYFSAD